MKNWQGNDIEECDSEELDKTLPDNCFVISHIGDGEYTCNIFGNVYSNFSVALAKVREFNPNCIIYKITSKMRWVYEGKERLDVQWYYYIGERIYVKSIKEHDYSKITRLTIAELDTKFDPGSY